MKSNITLLLLLAIVLFSCNKNSSYTNPLVGTWKFTEEYDGYYMGGNFLWNKVESSEIKTISFSSNNTYLSNNPVSNITCTGLYTLKGNNVVEITSNCQNEAISYTITELTNSSLILDCEVREGIIRHKYTR